VSREARTAVIPTEVAPVGPPPGAPRPDALARMERDWDEQYAEPAPAPPVPFGERVRRAAAVGAGALAIGGAAAAYPWITLVLLLVLVWLLRAGSLAASAVAGRRTLRGPKWHDGPRLVLSSPWHLARAVSGAGVLFLWALAVGAVAGLIGYAVRDLPTALFVGGAAAAVGLWTGPGGDRFRSPIGRVLNPAARTALPWILVCFALLAVAAVLTLVVRSAGPDWAPASTGPFGL
jgi:hypothetical protein